MICAVGYGFHACASHCCQLRTLRFYLFFKQKTAYEMRISDWSSDVCSSDLFALVPLVDALMVSRNLFTGLAAGDWLFVGFDAVMVLLAASFACAARIASRVTLPTSSRMRSARGTEATA